MPKRTPSRPQSPSRLRDLLIGTIAVLSFCAIAGVALSGDFTGNGTQPPLDNEIVTPGKCQFCHGDFTAESNHEPYPTWAGSMMANATRDPLFWAALDVANNDMAGVGDFCLRCHSPTGWLAGRSEPPGGSVDGCGLQGNLDDGDNDFEGVSCHLCHRMQVNDNPPPGQDNVYFENGQFWIDDEDCPNESGSGPCRRGPYEYAGTDDQEPPHPWIFSQYHVDADICGNCHNVSSPNLNLVDDNGVDTGIPFPVERTFKEWQQSDFAPGGSLEQTCQDCHMDQAEGAEAFACNQQQNDRIGNLASHRLVGGNTWIPAVLKGEYPALGRGDEFDTTIAWATEMLQERSADVELESVVASRNGATLTADVKITNLSGHKLPTGYSEGRRMWIEVTARDGQGDIVFESGAYDGETGDLTEDEQAKIYRVEQGIWNRNSGNTCDAVDEFGRPIFHFVLNNCIAIDNRIPPLGFSGVADPETQPVGYTYPETSPGSGILVNYDVTTYNITVPEDTPDPITVEASLQFQTASKEYIEFLRDQAIENDFPDDCISRTSGTPNMSRGELLYDMWMRYDRSPPVNMGTAAQEFAVSVFADGFESGDTAAWSITSIPLLNPISLGDTVLGR